MRKATDKHFCDFCGKSEDNVPKIVAGPNGIDICSGCAREAVDIFEAEPEAAETDAPATAVLAEVKAILALLTRWDNDGMPAKRTPMDGSPAHLTTLFSEYRASGDLHGLLTAAKNAGVTLEQLMQGTAESPQP